MAQMDPVIKAMAAIKRDMRKHVALGVTVEDKMMILQMAESEFLKLRKEISAGPKSNSVTGGTLSASGIELRGAESREIGSTPV